jgi:hypothetical protein
MTGLLVVAAFTVHLSAVFSVTSVGAQCLSTGATCISSSSSACRNLADGDYQACEGCTFYHSCSGGVNWANRLCPVTNQGGLRGRLVWRSLSGNQGYCDYSSTTCRECSPVMPAGCTSGSTTGAGCIRDASTSCYGLVDGDYQSCERCTVYHSCTNGLIVANRPCPRKSDGSSLVWVRDALARGHCDYTSSTCRDCLPGGGSGGSGSGGSVATTRPPCNSGSSTGTRCITSSSSSCIGLSNGDYQACEGCTFYHSCSNFLISSNRPCARRTDGTQLVWVTDRLGRGHCDWTSNTCAACNK